MTAIGAKCYKILFLRIYQELLMEPYYSKLPVRSRLSRSSPSLAFYHGLVSLRANATLSNILNPASTMISMSGIES